jgi:hypothetical protein
MPDPMSNDRRSSTPPATDAVPRHEDRLKEDRAKERPSDPDRKSDFPRQTMPAITPNLSIAERPAIVKLISGRSVVVLQSAGEERVEVRAASGDLVLSLRLTDEGPVFSLAGAQFEIAAAKSLTLSADKIHLAARNDLILESGKTLRAGGRDVEIIGHPGEVAIRANDDVEITGERVRLNSDDPPMPQSFEEHRARHAVSFEPFSGPISPPRLEREAGDGRTPISPPRLDRDGGGGD